MEIKDTSSVLDMNIHLKQAFGWMKLNGDGDENKNIVAKFVGGKKIS